MSMRAAGARVPELRVRLRLEVLIAAVDRRFGDRRMFLAFALGEVDLLVLGAIAQRGYRRRRRSVGLPGCQVRWWI